MAKKVKDTDYLFISTYLHSRERDLLTAARMERMIEAPTAEEAAKVLTEIGYGEFNPSSERELSAVLASEQEKLFEDLYRFVPDKAVVDVFKVKYDYHNLKTLLKARAMGVDGGRLLLDAGRVSAQEMNRAVTEGDYNALPELLRAAAEEAGEVLASTGDPQLSDFVLDRAYYAEMLSAARATGSGFLVEYVQGTIDAANLRSAVRCARLDKGPDFLRLVLVEGGAVSPADIAVTPGPDLARLYHGSPLLAAAEAGAEALRGGPLTDFEKLCDNAVGDYLAGAQFVPFGEAPLLGYLAARETEYTNIRILLMGRGAGLPAEVIRSRLRNGYV